MHIGPIGAGDLDRLASAGLGVDLDVEFDVLAVGKRAESLHLDFRLVHEHVRRPIRGHDEPKPGGIVKERTVGVSDPLRAT